MIASKVAATFLTPVAAKKLLEKIVEDVYDFLKKRGAVNFKKIQFGVKAAKLYNHIHKIQLVKTLWQVDKAVDIKSFYCDLHILIDQQRKKINNVDDFGERNNILIQGIAGQGKSILLRYLCVQCIKLGESIPIFIELRRIQPGETIMDYILKFLEIIDLKIDREIVSEILKTGKIILFLDGFDEVADTERQRLINEIEFLASSLEQLRIIITSRPETGIEMMTSFEVFKLDNLRKDEYKDVINKLTNSEKLADSLIKQVESHKTQLKDLLCTPLMVTLLLMSYKSFQELPTELSDFYDSIFQALLQRHDGAKPGYQRQRRCKLNDMQYRLIFEALCFESSKNPQNVFKYDDIFQFTSKAMKNTGHNVDPDNYIKDIVSVTCLLLKDGNLYRFIHKSVQEFYAAYFIKRKAEPVTKRFYSDLIDKVPGGLRESIRFLGEIDKYRFNKYYKLPYSLKILNRDINTLSDVAPNPIKEDLYWLFSSIFLSIEYNSDGSGKLKAMGWSQSFDFWVSFQKIDYAPLLPFILGNEVPFSIEKSVNKKFHIKVKDLLDRDIMIDQFMLLAKEIFSLQFSSVIESRKIIEQEEKQTISLY